MSNPAFDAVVIGASAGALEALSTLLPHLPAAFPLPVIAVVHLPPEKTSIIPEILRKKCAMKVREAEDKEPIRGGFVYFAPPDYHLLIEKSHHFALSSEEPVSFSRPSIDMLFETAADVYGPRLIGIVLTGANNDGTHGLKAIIEAGGSALVQCPATAHSSLMPRTALTSCPEAQELSLDQISDYLQKVAA